MESARLEVRVHPGSKLNRIVEAADGRLKVYVAARPHGGEANEATISLLASRIGVPKSGIRILRGYRSKNKLLLVEGLDVQVVLARLRATKRRAEDD